MAMPTVRHQMRRAETVNRGNTPSSSRLLLHMVGVVYRNPYGVVKASLGCQPKTQLHPPRTR